MHSDQRQLLINKRNKFKILKFTRKTIFNIIMCVMLLYFIFHSIYGSRGILAYFKLQAELEGAHQKLNLLRAERLEVENRAKLLRPGSLDKDMLDEKARNILGVVGNNELVFQKNPTKKDDD